MGEFKIYVRKEGIYEYLVQKLLHLYEIPEEIRPTDTIEYLKNNIASEDFNLKDEKMKLEIKTLNKTVDRLEAEKMNLTLRVADLEKRLLEKLKDGAIYQNELTSDDSTADKFISPSKKHKLDDTEATSQNIKDTKEIRKKLDFDQMNKPPIASQEALK